MGRARERVERALVSERDRRAVMLGAAVLVVLALYIVVQFFSSGAARFEKRVQTTQEELARVKSLSAEYAESKRRVETITNSMKEREGDLLPVVEKILVSEQVERGNFSINLRAPSSGDLYQETSVDVDIKSIALDKVIDVLYRMQTMPTFLKLSKLRLRTRFDDPSLMDVSFRVSTYKFNQEL